jgi:hypothetical protein
MGHGLRREEWARGVGGVDENVNVERNGQTAVRDPSRVDELTRYDDTTDERAS